MTDHVFSRDELIRQLLDLGVEPGGVLLVHMAFSKVKPVEGGPMGLITALQAAVGADGTLVMPSFSYDDQNVFDPAGTSCIEEMGVVADTFWRLPGAYRGDNVVAFAASGPHAAHIAAPSSLEVAHGLDSPVGRILHREGQVLLLGVGHSNNTTIHLAENLAGVRYRTYGRQRILVNGLPAWFDYDEVNHCCQNFQKMDAWLDERGLQRKGKVGNADARLMSSKAVVETALEQLRLNETVFLHPTGIDEECDAARASIPADGVYGAARWGSTRRT